MPVVLWHGMGDSAAGMVGIANILEDNIPGVYVHRIMIGGNLLTDTERGTENENPGGQDFTAECSTQNQQCQFIF